jgi:hypothetical protein
MLERKSRFCPTEGMPNDQASQKCLDKPWIRVAWVQVKQTAPQPPVTYPLTFSAVPHLEHTRFMYAIFQQKLAALQQLRQDLAVAGSSAEIQKIRQQLLLLAGTGDGIPAPIPHTDDLASIPAILHRWCSTPVDSS